MSKRCGCSNHARHRAGRRIAVVALATLIALVPAGRGWAAPEQPSAPAPPPLAPLPAARPADAKQVALGKLLFFDGRLSGDATVSCATCHDPAQAFTDGLPLSRGYPGTLYFRNTPTLLNVSHARYVYWDGRLPAADLPTVVRDHISEAHFMQADGRLVIERLRQVPGYESRFREAFGGEPTYGRILSALAALLQTLQSRDVPLDRFLAGDATAISDSAKRGLQLFRGKGRCRNCHCGPMLADGRFHRLGLPPNQDIFQTPERHITFRRFFRTLGVARYASLREDVGHYCVTQQAADRGRFRTPSLREVGRTPPYMHDGSLATLADVVDFFDSGGGPTAEKVIEPLGLSAEEKADLLAFLQTLSGRPLEFEPVKPPPYELRPLGEN